MQLTGCAQQLLLWLQIGHDAPHNTEIGMHENADNENTYNKNHFTENMQ
jgi:hypothetical protein